MRRGTAGCSCLGGSQPSAGLRLAMLASVGFVVRVVSVLPSLGVRRAVASTLCSSFLTRDLYRLENHLRRLTIPSLLPSGV